MGELEITIAAPFIHMRSSALSQMKLVFYYNDDRRLHGVENKHLECLNPHCLSRSERGIKKLFEGERCIYCDQKAIKVNC